MPGEDVTMTEALPPTEASGLSARLLQAFTILQQTTESHIPNTISAMDVLSAFIVPNLNPLAIYRAACCLRECDLREIVQVMVFSGPTALLPALRLLNIMRGLPGNWELAMQLLDEHAEMQNIERNGIRAMTLLAFLGGKKACDLCDWSIVIREALENGHEEASLALHMIMEKKWTGTIETVYRIENWEGEQKYSDSPSFWREMQWATYSREFCCNASFCDRPFVAQSPQESSQTKPSLRSYLEQPPREFGAVSSHYIRIGGVLVRRRSGEVGPGASERLTVNSSPKQKHLELTNHSQRHEFIYTPSLFPVLKTLAGALSYGIPIVLEGSAGCGKTSVISLLGRETTYKKPDNSNKVPSVTFIQMDSGVVPLPEGKGFQWRPGPIGLAIEKGEWLVFENLGQLSARSSSAVPLIITLAQLQPGDTLSAPGRGQPLRVNKGFRCIATRTTSDEEGNVNWEPPGGWEIWDRVAVPSLSHDEKLDLLKEKFPLVKDCVPRVLKCTNIVSEWFRKNRASFSRDTTLREAVRICNRLTDLRLEQGELMTAESALLETIDVLVSWCSEGQEKDMLLNAISAGWSLPSDVAKDLVSQHRPSLSVEDNLFRVGRSSLSVKVENDVMFPKRLTMTSYTLRLMEKIVRCLQVGEHVLLTGEAGSGKTALIQEVAAFLRTKLVVVNLSRQSELGDLMGAFRPVETTAVIPLLAKKFAETFCLTMSRKKNGQFLDALGRASRSIEHHERSVRLMERAAEAIPKSAKNANTFLAERWRTIADELKRSKRRVDFQFSEGVLAQAMRSGAWILLDEINLAPTELLERLVSVLDCGEILLPDAVGSMLARSEGFRLFAAMNPPTDVGKRPLPNVLRARFSEFHCGDMLDKDDVILLALHRFYGLRAPLGNRTSQLSPERRRPVRFSLRTLSRMLDFASGLRRFMRSGEVGVRRSLFEGAILSFATPLPATSRARVCEVAQTCLLKVVSSRYRLEPLSGVVTLPTNMTAHVRFVEGVPLEVSASGDQHSSDLEKSFIISPTVRETLRDVCRALALGTRRLPVVLQGPTAAGKTSLVTYLASMTGNSLIRINNHEHTDLSDYVGGYVATPNGALVFHEGPLSLNRLLDDNREILIPETGEVVKANAGFTVFATQNPPGLYGGRKELSRAFRSRFIEIQVPDLTDEDLLTILQQRCRIPPSFAKKMIAVMRELQLRRRTTSIFSGRDGFVTARDLFRWASRGSRSKEELAVHGFFLLAERSRRTHEREIVRDILLKVIGVDPGVLVHDALYSFHDLKTGRSPSQECLDFSMVATSHTCRMLTLMIHSVANSEPVLLVGSTGGGKTSCCAVISRALGLRFETVNCHQHTEASDIIGSYRPSRSLDSDGPLFEWVDGPLVRAMRQGSIMLIDEINMAEDAVVERLNSVMELERKLLLSEKGAVSPDKQNKDASFVAEEITASSMFRILATMNPGGDYGKKELSPALRNRLTEIWVPAPATIDDFSPIVLAVLSASEAFLQNERMQLCRKALCDFLRWLLAEYSDFQVMLSVRDISTWCQFIAEAFQTIGLDPLLGLVHGARLVFLDGLAVGSTGSEDSSVEVVVWNKLTSLLPPDLRATADAAKFGEGVRRGFLEQKEHATQWKDELSLFTIPRNETAVISQQTPEALGYSFDAPCTARNTARIARAMAVSKRPILLEGPPGCGKSSLVAALARASGFSFIRVNLSDATEMSDLIGSDSPGDVPGVFTFRAGPLLRAVQEGSWVLLDELNLASQSVLEGLNSVLDHRRSLFIPELSREVASHPSFRVFGAQNPACEGGGRRGLPKSFLNRFARVHMEAPTKHDIVSILSAVHPLIGFETTSRIVKTLLDVRQTLESGGHSTDISSFGLRDALRWCDLYCLGVSFHVVVVQGLQRGQARELAEHAYRRTFGFEWDIYPGLPTLVSADQKTLRLGQSMVRRSETFSFTHVEPCGLPIRAGDLGELQALSLCVNAGWPAVLSCEGSTTSSADGIRLVQTLASLYGKTVKVVHGASLSDCDEFMGGYCQKDAVTHYDTIQSISEFQDVSNALMNAIKSIPARGKSIDNQVQVMHNILLELGTFQRSTEEDGLVSFEWRKSEFVDAIEEGEWILIRDADACIPAILDRLNPVLERRPVSVVNSTPANEDGSSVLLVPHPECRIFFVPASQGTTVGSRGLSRALLDRSLKISLNSADVLPEVAEGSPFYFRQSCDSTPCHIDKVSPSYINSPLKRFRSAVRGTADAEISSHGGNPGDRLCNGKQIERLAMVPETHVANLSLDPIHAQIQRELFVLRELENLAHPELEAVCDPLMLIRGCSSYRLSSPLGITVDIPDSSLRSWLLLLAAQGFILASQSQHDLRARYHVLRWSADHSTIPSLRKSYDEVASSAEHFCSANDYGRLGESEETRNERRPPIDPLYAFDMPSTFLSTENRISGASTIFARAVRFRTAIIAIHAFHKSWNLACNNSGQESSGTIFARAKLSFSVNATLSSQEAVTCTIDTICYEMLSIIARVPAKLHDFLAGTKEWSIPEEGRLGALFVSARELCDQMAEPDNDDISELQAYLLDIISTASSIHKSELAKSYGLEPVALMKSWKEVRALQVDSHHGLLLMPRTKTGLQAEAEMLKVFARYKRGAMDFAEVDGFVKGLVSLSAENVEKDEKVITVLQKVSAALSEGGESTTDGPPEFHYWTEAFCLSATSLLREVMTKFYEMVSRPAPLHMSTPLKVSIAKALLCFETTPGYHLGSAVSLQRLQWLSENSADESILLSAWADMGGSVMSSLLAESASLLSVGMLPDPQSRETIVRESGMCRKLFSFVGKTAQHPLWGLLKARGKAVQAFNCITTGSHEMTAKKEHTCSLLLSSLFSSMKYCGLIPAEDIDLLGSAVTTDALGVLLKKARDHMDNCSRPSRSWELWSLHVEALVHVRSILTCKNFVFGGDSQEESKHICSELSQKGTAWTSIGLLRMRSFRLRTECRNRIDPSQLARASVELNLRRSMRARIGVYASSLLRRHCLGGDSPSKSIPIRRLEIQYEEARKTCAESEKRFVFRPEDRTSFSAFLAALDTVNAVITDKLIQSGLRDKLVSAQISEADLRSVEEALEIYQSCATTAENLGITGTLSHFRDLTSELVLGLREVQYGLICAARSRKLQTMIRNEVVWKKIQTFYDVSTFPRSAFHTAMSVTKALQYYKHAGVSLPALTTCAEYLIDGEIRGNFQTNHDISDAMSYMVGIWKTSSVMEEKEKAAKNSLHVLREVGSRFEVSGSEFVDALDFDEDQDFVDTFNPLNEEEEVELLGLTEPVALASDKVQFIDKARSTSKGRLNSEKFWRMHLKVFPGMENRPQDLDDLRSRRVVLQSLVKHLHYLCDDIHLFVEHIPTQWQMFAALEAVQLLDESTSTDPVKAISEGMGTSDFYRDANLSELTYGLKALQGLRNGVSRTQNKFFGESGGHPVLEEISAAIERVTNTCHVLTPLSKMVVGVEGVLRKADEWQRLFATATTTLKDEVRALSHVAVKWRRRERASWKLLMQNRVRAMESRASIWFLYLYDALIQEASLIDQSLKDEACQNIITTVDQFMRSAPSGEFACRLEMLISLAAHILSVGSKGNKLLHTIGLCIRGIGRFYYLNAPAISEELSKEKKLVEAKLAEFSKLTSWEPGLGLGASQKMARVPEKQLEYYRLKEDAQRTKRKLHKLCLEMDSVLRVPVYKYLTQEVTKLGFGTLLKEEAVCGGANPKKGIDHGKSTEQRILTSVAGLVQDMLVSRETRDNVFRGDALSDVWLSDGNPLLSKLPLFETRLNQFGMIMEKSQCSDCDSGMEFCRDARSTIRSRALQLRRSKNPSIQLKKRALVDLLQALRNVGLSPFENRKSESTVKSFQWLSSPDPSESPSFNKISNDLFYDGAQQLRRLRDVSDSRTRNTDITSDEAQKSQAMCTHLFDMACAQRESLNSLTQDVDRLATMSSHLQEIRKDLFDRVGRVWNSAARSHLLRTINKLMKIQIDLKLAHSSVTCALSASPKSDSLRQEQGPLFGDGQFSDTSDSLRQVSTILENGIQILDLVLQADDVAKLERGFKKCSKPPTYASCYERLVGNITDSKVRLDEELLRARALSEQNFAVQTLMPVTTFLHVALEELGKKIELQPGQPTMNPVDLKNGIEKLSVSAIEKVLVGAQNTLAWGKVSIKNEAESKIVTASSFENGKLAGGARQGTLRCAHAEILSHRQSSKIPDLMKILGELLELQEQLEVCMGYDDDLHRVGKRSAMLQGCVGKLVSTYIGTMVLPSLSKMGSVHCHSLALLRTVSSVFIGVCTEGFCRPDETNPESTEGEEMMDKTGAGFGNIEDGDIREAKNVSEDIEDEGQLIGLQSDRREEAEKEPNNTDQEPGFEMTNDFEGDLEDFEPEEDDKTDQNAQDPEKDLSAESGHGEDVIDERLWEQGDDPLGPSNGESSQADANKENQQTELKARSGDEASDKQASASKPSDDGGTSQEKEEEDRKDGEEYQEDGDTPDDEEAGNKNPIQGTGEDANEEKTNGDSEQEGSQSRLPDQLNLKGNEGDADGMEEGGADSMEEQELGSASGNEHEEELTSDQDEQTTGVEEGIQDPLTDSSPLKEQQNEETGIPEAGAQSVEGSDCEMDNLPLDGRDAELDNGMEKGPDMESNTPNVEEQPDKETQEVEQNGATEGSRAGHEEKPSCEDALSLPGRSIGGLEQSNNNPAQFKSEETEKSQQVPASGSGQLAPTDDEFIHGNSQEHGERQHPSTRSEPEPPTMGSVGKSGQDQSQHDMTDDLHASKDSELPDSNPLRVTANDDLISSWNKYLEVADRKREEKLQQEADTNRQDGALEYQEEDESDPDGLVALGAATKEQHQPLPDVAPNDTMEDIDDVKDDKPGELDKKLPSSSNAKSRPPQISMAPAETTNARNIPPRSQQTDEDEHSGSHCDEPTTHPARIAAESSTPDSSRSNGARAQLKDRKETRARMDISDNHDDEQDASKQHTESNVLEEANSLRKNVEELSSEEATSLWRKLVQSTTGGASSLCELLRLVLEPTIASKLGGGYRTGKRLNIRKVIEFVASDFRKDRIWLRRVRPDKRSYDVLLAIDDSESMSESRAGPMALESLALVTSALGKLEIGRLAVASFGAAALMVKDFDEPISISDVRGGQLLQHFCFSQRETNICELLQFMQDTLVGVKGPESVEQIKLVFVISDGRLSAREDIKRRLRHLRDANVLVAFLIIDKSGKDDTSIYDVRRVEYDSSGKIEVMPYMHDFPIEFYAVVQDVQRLPTILADALRQWVEITSTHHLITRASLSVKGFGLPLWQRPHCIPHPYCTYTKRKCVK
ncbi:AAA ATPase containing von Willebrand factor type A (vWA) domain and P-loop containing nucleoside triphosphate region [Chondrus crispus]|uniref:Midasin n=1 Tax=Chondrus crispus TaxID=2769 RepID=R7QIZ4_CHOCR|nr:AAA ATPase containing von Willebrand factor type A (vWA) domain and P-loop containing nucleoside triphosphate region [Chondrus crispus]CDF38039.1 AAA ATPase containing von Willebrand factor type A (vWA) domain and P-loop containing nucleoside triphosphate region [Chondrus crispus]|eukprot:XP_005717908.1 AAA ATPase containing von Willebrand factor type A (vWA) domain and P-loop containing nucleoside triphosphate region [Chondrus crispus]